MHTHTMTVNECMRQITQVHYISNSIVSFKAVWMSREWHSLHSCSLSTCQWPRSRGRSGEDCWSGEDCPIRRGLPRQHMPIPPFTYIAAIMMSWDHSPRTEALNIGTPCIPRVCATQHITRRNYTSHTHTPPPKTMPTQCTTAQTNPIHRRT